MTYIIAEVGSNWTSVQEALESIAMAKQCGADAVKFQWFESKDLYGHHRPEITDQSYIGSLLPRLKEKADACGIDFMCTVFDPLKISVIEPLVSRFKVAGSDCLHVELLEACNMYDKETIISTNCNEPILTVKDIWSQHIDLEKVIPMHCISEYPAKDANLERIKTLGYPCGYSDHTTDVTSIPVKASRMCQFLEKHFKLKDMNTPDNPHSLNPVEFQTMVKNIRGHHTVLPQQESDMKFRHRRRLIATSDIAKGDILERNGNYGAYRSVEVDASGLAPHLWELIQGKPAPKDYKQGEPIGIIE